jgi:hypothetical protein
MLLVGYGLPAAPAKRTQKANAPYTDVMPVLTRAFSAQASKLASIAPMDRKPQTR